jgi:arsenate reductase
VSGGEGARERGVVVWGIPSCGTVKKARAWLDERGVAHAFVDLRQTPPSAAKLASWARAFGVQALKNTSGGSYRALPAEKDTWSDERWLAAFAADPMLVRRPVVEKDGAALQVGWRAPPAL